MVPPPVKFSDSLTRWLLVVPPEDPQQPESAPQVQYIHGRNVGDGRANLGRSVPENWSRQRKARGYITWL